LSSQCGGDWHKEAAGFTRYRRKPIGPVERRGAIVFGVDDDGESPNAQAIGADRGCAATATVRTWSSRPCLLSVKM